MMGDMTAPEDNDGQQQVMVIGPDGQRALDLKQAASASVQ